mgnify:CR=1 FL=1
MQKEIDFNPTPKQFLAWEKLTDNKTTELGYGGAAGPGKTWLGCFWQASMREAYPGTAGLLGRRELKNLKRTTLSTFFKMALFYGWENGVHFTYNQQDSVIKWHNDSVIYLMDLGYMPSDPLYLRLGGLELTDGFVDESNEVRAMAIQILKTRIGRCKNDQYGLLPKLLETFNPDKGHVYSRFYKPWKEKTLPKHRSFIKALPKDNPYLPKEYIDQLKNADKVTKERLLFGNFEYDDDPARLFEYDAILDMFTNKLEPTGEMYISCDVARMGSDKTVIAVWDGLICKQIKSYDKTRTNEVVELLEEACTQHGVRRSHVVIDEDGVGGGVVDNYEGCVGFVNNSTPIGATNYRNLKTQCYFEFARLSNEGKIRLDDISVQNKESLIEELEQVKQKDIDKDGKVGLVGKEMVKEIIGRSPDISDSLMMRMYFEIQPDLALESYFI